MNGADLTYLRQMFEELLGKQILIWRWICGELCGWRYRTEL